MDTFSANSLKILDRSKDEFTKRFIDNLTIFKKDSRAELGQRYHSLICSNIKGYNVKKFEESLSKNEYLNWIKFREKFENIRAGFIKTEYSFLVKDFLNNTPYYLTGRFDAVFKNENGEIIIYDWKTLNLPHDVEDDLQTIVYLYCAKKIYKTKNIKMKYLSIEKGSLLTVEYSNEEIYKKRIEEIISKIL